MANAEQNTSTERVVSKQELAIPFTRSCEKEFPIPVQGKIKGKIPEWLEGTLIRVGSGLLHVGQDEYNHIFDGMALLHRFAIKNGHVTYQNKFLRSDTYRKNMAANRIVVDEFATKSSPDPCQTIFQRISSYFTMPDFTDNDLVNIIQFSDEFYACSETNYIWRINPENLDSLKKVSLTDFVAVRTGSAHAHQDKDGTVYNVGFTQGSSSGYSIMKFPPKETESSDAFAAGSVVSRIPATRKLNPSYFHSFGMSENYFVFLEQPLGLSMSRLLLKNFLNTSFSDSLQWLPEQKARFFVVRRDNGLIMSQQFLAEPLMVFHHINAYEEDDQLVVDMCCYEDGSVVKTLYVKTLQAHANDPENIDPYLDARAKRYVLPLLTSTKTPETENLVRLEGSKAKAYRGNDGVIICEPELLSEKDTWFTELPRINYDYNGKKYNYLYAMGRQTDDQENYLVKINVQTGETTSWHETKMIASEPVFVSKENAVDEDDGILLASLLSKTDEKKVSLVVLDTKTMTELGRSDFVTESAVPADFHGIFINQK